MISTHNNIVFNKAVYKLDQAINEFLRTIQHEKVEDEYFQEDIMKAIFDKIGIGADFDLDNFSIKNHGLLSSVVLGASLLLPNKSPEIPSQNNISELKNYIVDQRSEAKDKKDIKNYNFYNMLYSMIDVESKWNPKAKSIADKNGRRAWGLLQFRQSTIDDINRVYKTKYTINDALDFNKAIDMYEKYYNMLIKYHKYYKDKLNLTAIPNIEDISMMYNQGLTAWSPKNLNHNKAVSYYNRIKNCMSNVSKNNK